MQFGFAYLITCCNDCRLRDKNFKSVGKVKSKSEIMRTFSLKNVGNISDGKGEAHDIASLGAAHKLEVARVGLNLNAQLGIRRGYVQGKGKEFDLEFAPKQLLSRLEIFYGNHDVEVEADDRFGVGVNTLRPIRQ